MRLPVRLGRPSAAVLARWGGVPGLRTAKATLAAVLAYVTADLLNTSNAPILAPLTALLVVQLTVYETVAQGIQRVFSVLAGVLVAVGIATFVGLSWWSLGAVVAVSLAVGQFLHLGAHRVEVAISAMLVLAVGGPGAQSAATGRVYETLVGAVVGACVNFIVVPPVHVRPAGAAIGHLAVRMAQFQHGLADELRKGWSRAAADRWLNEVRTLSPDVSRADQSLARAEKSALLNPRSEEVRVAQPRLRHALTGLEHCYFTLRALCREIFDRTLYLPQDLESEAYSPEARDALADVLDGIADATSGVAEIASGTGPVEEVRARVQEQLVDLHRRRDRLSRLLLVDPHADAAAWQQHGALLATVDRLRTEIEAAVRPASEPWRPPPIGEAPRQAVRRVIDATAETAATAAAAAEAKAHAAAGDLRALHRRATDAETAVHAEEAAEAAAVVEEVAAEAAVIAAANAEVTESAEAETPRAEAETAGAEAERPAGEPRRSPRDGGSPA
jgi:hypothetical protein